MNYQTLTLNCQNNFETRTHCCFGISPFNSYFSESVIEKLAVWGKNEFSNMHFFVPDIPSEYTLLAQGYSLEKSQWKARRQGQYLKNKISRVLKGLLYSENEIEEMILDWKKLSLNSSFLTLYDEVKMKFDSEINFQKECLEATHWVMNKKVLDTSQLTEDDLKTAVKYLLCELPMFMDTPRIVKKDASVFCYHQRVNFLEQFFAGKLAQRPNVRQGFLVLEAIKENMS